MAHHVHRRCDFSREAVTAASVKGAVRSNRRARKRARSRFLVVDDTRERKWRSSDPCSAVVKMSTPGFGRTPRPRTACRSRPQETNTSYLPGAGHTYDVRPGVGRAELPRVTKARVDALVGEATIDCYNEDEQRTGRPQDCVESAKARLGTNFNVSICLTRVTASHCWQTTAATSASPSRS